MIPNTEQRHAEELLYNIPEEMRRRIQLAGTLEIDPRELINGGK